jgi:hypothetical protein
MKSQNNYSITNLLRPNLKGFFSKCCFMGKTYILAEFAQNCETILPCLVDVFFNSRHYNEYQLYSSSRRLSPLFILGSLQTGVSQEKWKEASPIL